MYQILSEKVKDNAVITAFRASNGAMVIMREPIHTPEEQQRITENFLVAAAKMLYPDVNPDEVERIILINDLNE